MGKMTIPHAGASRTSGFRAAALVLLAFGLFRCERTAVYAPKSPDSARFRVFHLGTYSSKLEDEKEIEGTIFQTTLSFDLAREGAGFVLNRKLDTMLARGYHKLSMPHELEKKVGLTLHLDSGLIPTRIDGYDSLKAVLSRVQQKEDFRKQLLLASDTAKYKSEWRDWWRLERFLPTGIKLETWQALPVEAANKSLETLHIDSARFDGPRPRLKLDCLDYSLYYHRTDSLGLLMEQFFFSNIQNHKYRKYAWGPSVVKGILQYSVERKTGLPCFHSKSETSDLELALKADKAKAAVHLYRYEEDIYEYQ
jgi:hypothetical protein